MKLKISVIGVGLGGKIHINRLKSSPDVELDSIIAPNRPFNAGVASAENVPLFHSIEECFKRRRPDGVIIASPNKFHLEHTKTCIENGIPALLEKPITANLNEGRELCELIEKYSSRVLVGHHRAHNPIIKIAQKAIRDDKIGKIVSVMGSAQFYKPDHYFDEGPWRKILGGGPILINMVHEIDNLRRLVGEISAVQAITSSNTRGFIVEDTAVINFAFQNGALGSFVLSDVACTARSWEQTTMENSGYPSYPDEDCYVVTGTKGSLAIPTMKLKYYPDGISPSWWTPFREEKLHFTRADPIELQLKHFVDIIKYQVDPLVGIQDGYKNLMVIDAIMQSASSKSMTEVVSNIG
jgi:predicted dehydrogenase